MSDDFDNELPMSFWLGDGTMNVLLDTLRFCGQTMPWKSITKGARFNAASAEVVFLSMASIWAIQIKIRLEK